MANKHQKDKDDHRKTNTGVDGIGGAGGSSGAGGVRASAPHEVGDVSGIDADLDENDVPAPGSTGKGGPASERQTESKDGLPGKTRGNSTESTPSQAGGS